MRTPFDRIFKNTAEGEARALLHLFGLLPIGAAAEVTELNREIGLEAVHLDHLYEVRTPAWHGLYHFEFQTRYATGLPERVAEYQMVAWLRYRLPVFSMVILPVQRFAPTEVPESASIAAGGLGVESRFRVLKMWELDPAAIFELDRPNLLPLVPLAASTLTDWTEAAVRLAAEGNSRLAGAFLTLGSLRYHRTILEGLLEKVLLEKLLSPDMIRDSWFLEPIIAEAKAAAMKAGLEEGRQAGREDGRVAGMQAGMEAGQSAGRTEEARRLLVRLIATRFPDLPVPTALESIDNPDALERLFDAIAAAQSSVDAKAALERAVSKQI